MKPTIYHLIPVLLTANSLAAPIPADYTSFFRQIPQPNGVAIQVDLDTTTAQVSPGTAASGPALSPLPLGVGGAKYVLFSAGKSAPYITYELSTAYVGVTVPQAAVVIDTEDPYGKVVPAVSYDNPTFATATIKTLPVNVASTVRRTRIDRPFKVYVTTAGLSGLASAPDSQKRVDFRRQVLSYGSSNTGEGVNRSLATYAPASPAQFLSNAVQCTTFSASVIPGSPRTSVRGEETFAVWTLKDTQIPAYQIEPNMLASQRVEIWPITTGSASGITEGQKLRFAVPKVTYQYVDTYPLSNTYAQVYKGDKRLNVQGQIVPGSSKLNTTTHSESYLTTTGVDFDALFTSDGVWTMEILTDSCFGIERLGAISFTVDREIRVNGNFTTIE